LLDDALGELASGIIRGVFSKKPAKEFAAARQGEADREDELSAKGVAIHRASLCS
jgi:hypothetical protein